ncbi:uncharacterized protein LOC129581482 [Paramacrobiotus metropolitanus]|uniref:uncharacterized protein LOC129581482 n=1 Tax=Paramacrobiotus metropolitanus TaxID=2943436 RepID=UPI0024457C33|nr:uncharacterized protein LOC129581482 [Paramacrobiotus metropolitanus]
MAETIESLKTHFTKEGLVARLQQMGILDLSGTKEELAERVLQNMAERQQFTQEMSGKALQSQPTGTQSKPDVPFADSGLSAQTVQALQQQGFQSMEELSSLWESEADIKQYVTHGRDQCILRKKLFSKVIVIDATPAAPPQQKESVLKRLGYQTAARRLDLSDADGEDDPEESPRRKRRSKPRPTTSGHSDSDNRLNADTRRQDAYRRFNQPARAFRNSTGYAVTQSPGGYTHAPFRVQAVCLDWNRNSCQRNNCKYDHNCGYCGAKQHRAPNCPGNGAGGSRIGNNNGGR